MIFFPFLLRPEKNVHQRRGNVRKLRNPWKGKRGALAILYNQRNGPTNSHRLNWIMTFASPYFSFPQMKKKYTLTDWKCILNSGAFVFWGGGLAVCLNKKKHVLLYNYGAKHQQQTHIISLRLYRSILFAKLNVCFRLRKLDTLFWNL